jgi:hypothetical protein
VAKLIQLHGFLDPKQALELGKKAAFAPVSGKAVKADEVMV